MHSVHIIYGFILGVSPDKKFIDISEGTFSAAVPLSKDFLPYTLMLKHNLDPTTHWKLIKIYMQVPSKILPSLQQPINCMFKTYSDVVVFLIIYVHFICQNN